MFQNYLKTAFRSLLKNKSFTALNTIGLTVGMAACLLISLYVVDELSYDRMYANAKYIYRVTLNASLNGHGGVYATTEGPLEKAIRQFPEIKTSTRIVDKDGLAVSARKFFFTKDHVKIEESRVAFSESSLFAMFTLPTVSGTPSLDEPHTAVITQSTALKYFHTKDAVGKTLVLNDSDLYKVTAVIVDMPAQSHFRYDFLLSFSSLQESQWTGWGYSGVHTYLQLKPDANIPNLEAKIRELELANSPVAASIWTSGGNYLKTSLTPLLAIHLMSGVQYELSPGGNKQYIYIFTCIALLIVMIACINFMNLSTARSAGRAKEVGIRKVLGSSRKYLILQFMTESVIVTAASMTLAVLLAAFLLPLFNQLSGKDIHITKEIVLRFVPILLLAALLIGTIAGSYPSLFLSAFQPIQVLKGKLSHGFKGSTIRSSLVIFQFAVSVFLIIGTLAIYTQLNFIRNKNLGFEREHLLVVKNTESLGNRTPLFRDELKKIPGVTSSTMTAYLPTGDERLKTGLFPEKSIDGSKDMLTEFWPVDESYLQATGIQLLQGRNFSQSFASDSSAIMVNEAFIKKYGFKDPLNRQVYRFSKGLQAYHIIGIIKNFNFESLKSEIGPLALVYEPNYGAVTIKVKTADLSNLMLAVEQTWKKFSPQQQFDYSFADADFDAIYRSENRAGSLFISFSVLAILIACLGLFGLTAYAAEQRSKEIGIRKILGSSVAGIIGLLSVDFIKLVLIAIALGSPLAWYAMNRWLQDFSYRTNMQVWMVAVAGIMALLIAFITISVQAFKAASINPIKSIRTE